VNNHLLFRTPAQSPIHSNAHADLDVVDDETLAIMPPISKGDSVETFSDLYFMDHFFWIRFGAAVFCGAVIGWERERIQKPAGLRTTILICLGSCLFVMAQQMITKSGLGVLDHSRIAAQVVTGVGFLGAGAIIRQGVTVTGLTTAATIWLIAAVGVIIGSGYPYTAIVVTVCTLLILLPMRWFERIIFRSNQKSVEASRS